MKAVTTAVHVSGKQFLILDYLVPPSFEFIGAGWGVICPLKGKSRSGLVLEVKESSGKAGLKEITGVIKDCPVVSQDLIRLVFWISDNYMVELNRGVRLIFPPFARGNWTENLELTGGREELDALSVLNPETEGFVDYIWDRKHASLNTLESLFGKDLTAFCMKWLLESGLAVVTRTYRREPQKRFQGNMVALSLDDPEAFVQENKRARKQVEVIEVLRNHGGQYPVNRLLNETGASKQVIKTLENKGAVNVFKSFIPWEEETEQDEIVLTGAQQACIDIITEDMKADTNGAFLIHGVTGSGKTEVYVRAAEFAVSQGKKVIVIVPEIALSSQLIRYFQKSFGRRAVVLHSRLTLSERSATWNSISRGEVDVVIGTRSAVFAPFSCLGLIIVDEEHDRSLKQESSPRYNCVDVAAERARLNNGVLLLGSATPSLETLLMAQKGLIRRLEMPQRIGGGKPCIRLVDMREELRKGNTTILSLPVKEAIRDRLDRNEQVIAFINRRGYASFVNCRNCGFVFKCRHCDISLTYHARYNALKCHYCGFSAKLPETCPQCGSSRIKAFGLGTEKVEEALQSTFPQARILRLDSDAAARAGAHERILGAVARGECDILIGTQMVTKGFDFPGVTLVCVIAADLDLNLPDFRAEERTFQLLTQVSGRAGRRHIQGEVLIQTYSPESPGIFLLAQDRQEDFYALEMARREKLDYPPFSRFVRLLFTGRNEGEVIQSAERVKGRLCNSGCSLLGPAPAPLERIKDLYRWHMILRDFLPEIKEILLDALEEERVDSANKVNISIDVDPQSFM